MKIAGIVSFLAALIAAASSASPESRIVGGEKADKGEWPWQLALYQTNKFQCGASIVDSKWAVSAAHCIGLSPNQYQILAGTNKNSFKCPSSECVTRTLKNATRHPQYSGSGFQGFPNDIAYLSWEGTIEESTGNISIKYIERATKNDQVGKKCYITGWGRNKGGGPLPADLYEAKVDILTTKQCQKIWGSRVTDKHVCIHDLSNFTSGACNGDSGGPLVCEVFPKKWELVGATSWGVSGCNTSYPSVYTRVSSYNNWLDSQAELGY